MIKFLNKIWLKLSNWKDLTGFPNLSGLKAIFLAMIFLFGVLSPGFLFGNNLVSADSDSCKDFKENDTCIENSCNWLWTNEEKKIGVCMSSKVSSDEFYCSDEHDNKKDCDKDNKCRWGNDEECHEKRLIFSNPNKAQNFLAQISSTIVSVFTPITAFMVEISGMLLQDDWIYGKGGLVKGPDFDMKQLLKAMWIVIRDIVNIVFILILLAIAFINVVGAGSEWSSNFKISSMLPNIAIAIIAVNFTWKACEYILDAGNVTTHIVFGLFQDTSKQLGLAEKKGNSICTPSIKGIYYKTSDAEASGTPVVTKQEMEDIINKNTPEDCKERKDRRYGNIVLGDWKNYDDFNSMSGSKLLELFAYGILHIERLPLSVDPENQNFSNLMVSSIASLVLMVVILVILFSLTVVLGLRIIMVWINIVLSPLFVLMPILSPFGGTLGDADNYIGIRPLLKWAFMPAYIVLPMVIGMIMIMAGQTMGLEEHMSEADKVIGEGGVMKGKFIMGINSIQALLWYILAIVVMWTSVKLAADSGGEITNTVIGGVKGMFEGAAKWAGQLPMYANLLPVYNPKGGKDGKGEWGKGNVTGLTGAISDKFRRDPFQAKKDAAAALGWSTDNTAKYKGMEKDMKSLINNSDIQNKILDRIKTFDTRKEAIDYITKNPDKYDIKDKKDKLIEIIKRVGDGGEFKEWKTHLRGVTSPKEPSSNVGFTTTGDKWQINKIPGAGDFVNINIVDKIGNKKGDRKVIEQGVIEFVSQIKDLDIDKINGLVKDMMKDLSRSVNKKEYTKAITKLKTELGSDAKYNDLYEAIEANMPSS